LPPSCRLPYALAGGTGQNSLQCNVFSAPGSQPHQFSTRRAPRHIAEGFGRYLPREFSQYLRIANGSLMETTNHLQDGRDRGYFTDAEIEPLLVLGRRASAAVARLLKYLQNAPNPRTRNP